MVCARRLCCLMSSVRPLTLTSLVQRWGHLSTTQVLLDAGAAVTRPSGWTPCHVAARYGHWALLREFAGRQPLTHSARDHRQRTPLHLAALRCDTGWGGQRGWGGVGGAGGGEARRDQS